MEDLKKEAQKLLDDELMKWKVNEIAQLLDFIRKSKKNIKEAEEEIKNIEVAEWIPSKRLAGDNYCK